MNVPSPEWASLFPSCPHPLGPALRTIFDARNPIPGEFERLLRRLELGRKRVNLAFNALANGC